MTRASKTSLVKRHTRLTLVLMLVAGFFIFRDLIYFWVGSPDTKIVRLEVEALTFLGDDVVQAESRTIIGRRSAYSTKTVFRSQEVKRYLTPEQEEIFIYPAKFQPAPGMFVRATEARLYHAGAFKTLTTYRPYVAWYEVLSRLGYTAILGLVVWVVCLVAMLILGKSPGTKPVKKHWKTKSG